SSAAPSSVPVSPPAAASAPASSSGPVPAGAASAPGPAVGAGGAAAGAAAGSDTTSNAPLATTARHVPATTARAAAWATTRTGDRMVPMMTPPAPGANHPNRTFRRTALADHAVVSRLAAWSGSHDMLGAELAGVVLLLRSTTRRGHHPVPPHSRTQGETHACSSCHLRRRR